MSSICHRHTPGGLLSPRRRLQLCCMLPAQGQKRGVGKGSGGVGTGSGRGQPARRLLLHSDTLQITVSLLTAFVFALSPLDSDLNGDEGADQCLSLQPGWRQAPVILTNLSTLLSDRSAAFDEVIDAYITCPATAKCKAELDVAAPCLWRHHVRLGMIDLQSLHFHVHVIF